jgi:hypothetical protein
VSEILFTYVVKGGEALQNLSFIGMLLLEFVVVAKQIYPTAFVWYTWKGGARATISVAGKKSRQDAGNKYVQLS